MLRILAPTDFSTAGYNATLVAMQLAQRFSWEVVFVHAMPKPPVPATSPEGLFQAVYKEEERKTKEKLREECQHLFHILDMRHGEVQYKTVVVPTPFAESMLQVIAQQNIELVVMGSQGSNNFKKIFLGSNTLELMRLTPVPLLIIPSDVVFNGFKSITILVEPKDCTYRPGIRILERLARSYDAMLHFLVITQDGKTQQDISALCQPREKWQDVLEMPSEVITIAESDILLNLQQHIAQSATDLLVLLPSRKSLWEEFFSGSITEELVSKAKVPLLILPI